MNDHIHTVSTYTCRYIHIYIYICIYISFYLRIVLHIALFPSVWYNKYQSLYPYTSLMPQIAKYEKRIQHLMLQVPKSNNKCNHRQNKSHDPKQMQHPMRQIPIAENGCNTWCNNHQHLKTNATFDFINTQFENISIFRNGKLQLRQTNITLVMTNTKTENKCHIWCGNYIVKSKSKVCVCVCGWGWGVGGLFFFFFFLGGG